MKWKGEERIRRYRSVETSSCGSAERSCCHVMFEIMGYLKVHVKSRIPLENEGDTGRSICRLIDGYTDSQVDRHTLKQLNNDTPI